MRMLRVLRGALGTAIAWALPWAVVGAVLQLLTVLTNSGASGHLESPLTLTSFTLQGGLLFGAFGALTGGAFTVGAFLIGLELFSSVQLIVTATAYGVVTFLAAGSAWTMLRIARRAELGPGDPTDPR